MRLSSTALRGAALAIVVTGAGCADTGSDEKAAVTTVTATPNTTAGAKTLEVIGDDYEYKGVPAKIAPGTVISFTNASKREVHELVAVRVKDGETRSTAELLELPDEEGEKVTEFKGVAIAYPGEKAETPAGPLNLSQPGRYLFFCFIPTGADPVAYKEASSKATDGPPKVAGGPPHIKSGMLAEVTVG